MRPIPTGPPPDRRARARSLPGRAAPVGRARCRRLPVQPSRSRPHRTQGTRLRRRRKSKDTRKNMRHPSSSAPSPKLPYGPVAPGQGAADKRPAPVRSGHQPPRYTLPATQRVPPSHDAIPPRQPRDAHPGTGDADTICWPSRRAGQLKCARQARQPGNDPPSCTSRRRLQALGGRIPGALAQPRQVTGADARIMLGFDTIMRTGGHQPGDLMAASLEITRPPNRISQRPLTRTAQGSRERHSP